MEEVIHAGCGSWPSGSTRVDLDHSAVEGVGGQGLSALNAALTGLRALGKPTCTVLAGLILSTVLSLQIINIRKLDPDRCSPAGRGMDTPTAVMSVYDSGLLAGRQFRYRVIAGVRDPNVGAVKVNTPWTIACRDGVDHGVDRRVND